MKAPLKSLAQMKQQLSDIQAPCLQQQPQPQCPPFSSISLGGNESIGKGNGAEKAQIPSEQAFVFPLCLPS